MGKRSLFLIKIDSLDIDVRDSFSGRLFGALGDGQLDSRYAIWLSPCGAVHTFGMRESMSIVFLDQQLKPMRVIANAWPNRVYRCPGARSVIEMARKAELALVQIMRELSSLDSLVHMQEYIHVGRIKARIENAA
jgi:hypothetical protein